MVYRLITFTLLFLLVSCSWQRSVEYNRQPSSEIFHLILDIDWTIVSHVPDERTHYTHPYYKLGDTVYRLNDGAEELIKWAHAHPDIKLYLFSGGGEIRNRDLARMIKIGDQFLIDYLENIYSRSDLKVMEGVDENARFSEKLKKDVRIASQNLDKVMIIEDDKGFSLGRQYDRNFLWLGRTLKVFENYAEAERAASEFPDDPYLPKNYLDWLDSRTKMYQVLSVLQEADRSFALDVDSIGEIARLRQVEQTGSIQKASWLYRLRGSQFSCSDRMELIFRTL